MNNEPKTISVKHKNPTLVSHKKENTNLKTKKPNKYHYLKETYDNKVRRLKDSHIKATNKLELKIKHLSDIINYNDKKNEELKSEMILLKKRIKKNAI